MFIEKGYCKYSDGKEIYFPAQHTLKIDRNDIVELVVPSNTKFVHCKSTHLHKLIIGDYVDVVDCRFNPYLNSVKLSGTCKEFHCDLHVIEKYYEEWKDHPCNISNSMPHTFILDTIITNHNQ